MTVALAPWHAGLETSMAGSVYAAEPGERVDAARALVAAGMSVHVDVMVPDEGLPTGVTLDELAQIARVVPRHMLGIHLIGSADGVRRLLPAIPDAGDLYLPLGTFSDRGGRLWAAVWNEADAGTAETMSLDGYDGVLVMLLEPGTSGIADPTRLALVQSFSARTSVAVDGGVTRDLFPYCRNAGATTVVVGRALLTDPSLLTDTPLEGHP